MGEKYMTKQEIKLLTIQEKALLVKRTKAQMRNYEETLKTYKRMSVNGVRASYYTSSIDGIKKEMTKCRKLLLQLNAKNM